MDHLYFESGAAVGQTLQGSAPPFVAHKTAEVGRRPVVNTQRAVWVLYDIFRLPRDRRSAAIWMQSGICLRAIADFTRALD